MIHTSTQALSKTYSEAKARYVMGKVTEDLLCLMNRGIIKIDRVNSIYEDVFYLLNQQVLNYFELQFKKPNGYIIGGLHYKVKSRGDISSDEESGNIDFWTLSKDTRVTLFVSLDTSASNYDKVNSVLESWGWGTGNALTGTEEHLKDYSKGGYGLSQIKKGDW